MDLAIPEGESRLMQDVRMIVLDVDGTLTDGLIHYGEHGESKSFHVADGLGIVMAQAIGLRVAVISGRRSAAVDKRMAELKVTEVVQGSGNKAQSLAVLMAKYALMPRQVAFVGDDLNDLPAFAVAGIRIAVADAAKELRLVADFVTERPGGRGAVRDAVVEILKQQGRYDEAVQAYLQHIARGESARQ